MHYSCTVIYAVLICAACGKYDIPSGRGELVGCNFFGQVTQRRKMNPEFIDFCKISQLQSICAPLPTGSIKVFEW